MRGRAHSLPRMISGFRWGEKAKRDAAAGIYPGERKRKLWITPSEMNILQ